MATNILALPLAQMNMRTGTNEDWFETLKYVVDDGTGTLETMPQLDLRGIAFAMELRRVSSDHEVILGGSTKDKRIVVGAAPDYGFLLLRIDNDVMRPIKAGEYVGDIVATDEQFTRVCIQFNLTLVEGITR
jgi:hypothetical protein